ncbi:hypothetical protein R1flu_028860 [Riccia fluitans]|uniref:Uncharacterized protein n=1 Tax=Riccia fluitans TaxID=41844 RepID=A0ABD1XN02_9MARC
MVGGHGTGPQYADLPLHAPKRWQKALGTGLCTVMWLWVMHRARKDGPVVMGWRHPWEGHRHDHGDGDRVGGGHGEKRVPEEKNERAASGHCKKAQESEKKSSDLKVAPRKNIEAHDLAASKNHSKAAKVMPSLSLRDQDSEVLETKKIPTSLKSRGDELKSARNESKEDAGVKQPSREKSIPVSKKEQMLQRAIEKHPELLSLFQDDQ